MSLILDPKLSLVGVVLTNSVTSCRLMERFKVFTALYHLS